MILMAFYRIIKENPNNFVIIVSQEYCDTWQRRIFAITGFVFVIFVVAGFS